MGIPVIFECVLVCALLFFGLSLCLFADKNGNGQLEILILSVKFLILQVYEADFWFELLDVSKCIIIVSVCVWLLRKW